MNKKCYLWTQQRIIWLLFAVIVCGLSCTTPTRRHSDLSATALRQFVCSIGQQSTVVQGQLWFKVASQEVNGQFLADVVARDPDPLRIEVNNLLGGTEALITVEKHHLKIIRNHELREEKEYFWGGVPLRWASDLFLGRIPCPEEISGRLALGWNVSLTPDGDLRFEEKQSNQATSVEIFLYRFKDVQGKPWPNYLRWEKRAIHSTQPSEWIEFAFDDPDQKSASPKKWDIQSSRGRLRVQWRNRDVTSVSLTPP